MLRRNAAQSTYDAEILRLALPALGSLAAGPLYVLVDTAIVGHLGTAPLAGLALAGVLLSAVSAVCVFLAYATTAQTGRAHAAGQQARLESLASQALWLAGGVGLAFVVVGQVWGRAALTLLGGSGQVAELAGIYLQIGVLGLPFALIALAGQGFLRGVKDLRTPLVLVVGGNVLNVLLEVLFIYGLGWGLAGSAWATVIAQAAMGAGFIRELWRASGGGGPPDPRAMGPMLRMSYHILLRTASLYATLLAASAVVARLGDASLAAHQVLFQLFAFLALLLDAIAIAGQVLVSQALGSGDQPGAIAAARRMIGWSTLAGAVVTLALIALSDLLPRAFTEDPAVLERVHAAWAIFALTQPLNGAVFALDGILIGAGDSRYLMWAMAASSAAAIPLAVLALIDQWGLVGVWYALAVLILVRLATTGSRFMGHRWAVTGPLAAT